jgi:hypothetical protein
MQRLTVLVGVILVAIGAAGYLGAAPNKGGVMLLAGVGAVLIVCGWVAGSEKARMHAMHAAVLAGLIGLVAGVVVGLSGGGEQVAVEAVGGEQAGTGWPSWVAAVVCAIYVVMCVRSFVMARLARKSGGAS